MQSKIRGLIGSRAFYAMVLAVVLPIIVQNAISNFVNLLDNLMVGRIGTEQMSGVAIANQLVFVFNLAVFGAVSGAGIFTAQFHGAGNVDGVRATLRYKFLICMGIAALAILLFLLRGPQLIGLYLTDTADPARAERTLGHALRYLHVMLFGLIPFALTQCYAGTLRETGETTMPMVAGIIAVCVNLLFNYLLIFGHLFFPALGVRGAAYATVLSRFVELAIIATYTHAHSARHRFAEGLYSSMAIPGRLARSITRKGMPLLLNEFLWSLGIATLSQIYSLRGLDVVAATNISSTVYNLFSVAFLSMGSATAIIVGQALGANDIDEAKDYSWKLMGLSVAISVALGAALFALSRWIPLMYNTTDSVHALAASLLRVGACVMPLNAVCNCSYFVLRSGGKTGVTFLFDCVYTWALMIPFAYVLAHFTGMPIVPLYLCVQLTELVKCALGLFLVQKGIWINNIVESVYSGGRESALSRPNRRHLPNSCTQ